MVLKRSRWWTELLSWLFSIVVFEDSFSMCMTSDDHFPLVSGLLLKAPPAVSLRGLNNELYPSTQPCTNVQGNA